MHPAEQNQANNYINEPLLAALDIMNNLVEIAEAAIDHADTTTTRATRFQSGLMVPARSDATWLPCGCHTKQTHFPTISLDPPLRVSASAVDQWGRLPPYIPGGTSRSAILGAGDRRGGSVSGAPALRDEDLSSELSPPSYHEATMGVYDEATDRGKGDKASLR